MKALGVIDQLADAGVSKINFAGGEPFIRPDLGLLIKHAHDKGLITGVITNGSFLTTEWVNQYSKYLDWLGVSIDSVNHDTNVKSGRHCSRSKAQDITQLCSVLNLAKNTGVLVKINTVVSQYNLNEDLNDLILRVSPHRWKIFQVLPIENANRNEFNFEISDEQYQCFIARHKKTMIVIDSFKEDNRLMRASYVMINPEGKFYDNSNGYHIFSDSILNVGVEKAFSQVEYDHSTFIERGGQTAIFRSNEKAS